MGRIPRGRSAVKSVRPDDQGFPPAATVDSPDYPGWAGLGALISTPATRAATTMIPAPTAVASAKPWTMATGRGPANAAVAATAMGVRAAVPSDAPTCCVAFTTAEATPAWRGSTPRVAVLKAGTIMVER